MSRYGTIILALILSAISLLAVGCTGQTDSPVDTLEPSATSPAGLESNFRLLISDDANAIDKFTSVNVTISEIGVHSGSTGNWTTIVPDIDVVDLKPLIGENALEIWSGNLTAGEYNKVFVYVTGVNGTLTEEYGGRTADIKLPGDKLQISKPFTVSDNATTSFVYDITVVEAGKSGQYILQPQIAQSGAEQKFREVEQNENGESPEYTLENTRWSLESYGPSDNLTPVIEDTEITLGFDADTGEFSGIAGCNHYTGFYEVDGQALTVIPPIAATEMYCMEPEGVMAQETTYLTILQAAVTYSIDDDALTITCGNNVLNFESAGVPD
jgi:heat shock protein HslJ